MPTKEEVAAMLAQEHYEMDDALRAVYRLVAANEDAPGEPVKLLEVNAETVPIGIMPLRFGPHPASGLHYPLVIAAVTPEEFGHLRSGDLHLPDGWTLGQAIRSHSDAEKAAA